MKRKVNINRDKISSGEIAARRNFGSLIKNYPQLTNPFRRTSWRTKGILWVALASVATVYYVMNREVVFKEYNTDFPSYRWEKTRQITFTPDIHDTAHTYKVTLALRHVHGFRFRDMEVKLKRTSPSGQTVEKEYTFPVMKNETEYLSECAGDICDLEAVIEPGTHFSEEGTYTYIIEHSMPQDTISNIMEFGLTIEKNP